MKPIILILSYILFLTACSSNPPTPVEKIIYINTPLTLPAKPLLPILNSSEVKCLNDETKKILIDRDRKRADYIEQLELIINSTKN